MRRIFFSAILFFALTDLHGQPSANDIVFYGCQGNVCHIYSMRAGGSGQVRLTNDSYGLHWSPSWSPDGTKIIYCSVSEFPAVSAIWTMNADGTDKVKIFDSVLYLYGPVLSPDGSKIAVSFSFDESSTGIFVMNADGTNVQNLELSCVHCFGHDWSPNGNKILFTADSALSVVNADGTDQIFLNDHGANATWSPDGSKIAFQSDHRAGIAEIYVMNADGSNPVRITDSTNDWYPEWSPDGTKLAFHSDRAKPGLITDLYVMNADGSSQVRMTRNAPFASFRPRWKDMAFSSSKVPFDFDADGRSDVSVFRPSDGTWYIDRSTAGFAAVPFGLSSDDLAPSDFDADRRTDIAIFRDGVWRILRSSDRVEVSYQFGQAGDIPVPGDYTGDGRHEIAVYRNGEWWSQDLTNGHWSFVHWGSSTDRPVPADYDGDGRTDPAVYRDGTWYMLRSSLGSAAAPFGAPTDTPIPADYDGDGKTDLAVFREGVWYILQSTDGFTAFTWGLGTDVPVPADYDGDGKTDAAIFRDGEWWMLQTTGGITVQHFGQAGDRPLPSTTNLEIPRSTAVSEE
jgi:Tol biopolymer transport system component